VNGDFVYRIRAAADADLAAVTNWLIAAQDAGGGETYAFAENAPLASVVPAGGATLELRWTAFGRLDPSVEDTDGDTLTDWEELMVYRTAPREWDMDFDGLSDGEEILKYGTSPFAADSLNDGTNDFWRVVDAASLTNAPWMEDGDGLVLLTLETRLEGAPGGLAVLRIGDALVPVLPGTTLVSRVAVSNGVVTPFVLLPAPGLPPDAAAAVALTGPPLGPLTNCTFVVLDDPGFIFDLSAMDNALNTSAPQSQGIQSQGVSAQGVSAQGVQPQGAISSAVSLVCHGYGSILSRMMKMELSAGLFCPHTGHRTLTLLSAEGLEGYSDPRLKLRAAPGLGRPSLSVSEDKLKQLFPVEAGTVGFHTVDLLCDLCADHPRKGNVALVPFSIPAHICVPPLLPTDPNETPHKPASCSYNGDTHSAPPDCDCPTHWPNAYFCPCSAEGSRVCICPHDPAFADPWAVTNTLSSLAPVPHDRPSRILIIGETEAHNLGVGTVNHPGNDACDLCGCAYMPDKRPPDWLEQPSATFIYRLTAGLGVWPNGTFITNGVFTLCGAAPSRTVDGDVFTWRAKQHFYRGRYTVLGLSNHLASAGGPVTNAPFPALRVGVTNSLALWTGVGLPSGAVTLTLEGAGGADVWVRNVPAGTNDLLVTSTGRVFTCGINEWRDRYTLDDGFTSVAVIVGTDPGGCTFKLKYGGGSISLEVAQTFTVFELLAEPVTSGTDSSGHVYNPSGMPIGGTARFKISITDGVTQNGDITWTITAGASCASFVGGNTGPEVAVHADASGGFMLEATINGITPPHVKPYFNCQIFPAVNVPVTVWIVRDNLGTISSRDPATIPGLLADANKILWQKGITLVQNGSIHYVDNDAWLNPSTAGSANVANFDALMDCSINTGGVELYFVQTITGESGGDLNGIKRLKGIAIASNGTSSTVAHEVLHACGLDDIYPQLNRVSLPGVCTPGMLPSDWNGGYYPSGLMQKFVIARLVMSPTGYTNVPLPRADIPSGRVWGYRTHTSSDSPANELELRKVGQGDSHQTPVSQ
jgi:hypothetical protein